MTLDEDMLADVLRARARLDDLEDLAWKARDDLHAAVRRLHLNGASLREIAQVLGMSHQRVHQIVGVDAIVEVPPPAPVPSPMESAAAPAPAGVAAPPASAAAPAPEGAAAPPASPSAPLPPAGPPAPSGAAPSAGDSSTPSTCSFCASPSPFRLLSSPGRVLVCDACVRRAQRVIRGIDETVAVDGPGGREVRRGVEARPCSFCRRPGGRDPQAELDDGSVRICQRCVERCEQVLVARDAGGGQRLAMTRRSPVRCAFCNAPPGEVAKLIAGPGIHICNVCVRLAVAVASGAEPRATRRAAVLLPAGNEPHACQFCHKTPARVERNQMVKGGRGRICGECLRLCSDILEEEGATTSSS